jgi:ribosomal protein L40E
MLFLGLFSYALVNLVIFLIAIYQSGNTWSILFDANRLLTLLLYGIGTIASPIIIFGYIAGLFLNRKFKIDVSDGKFKYYSDKECYHEFNIDEMIIRSEIKRVPKRQYISDLILYVCEKGNDSFEVDLHCGLMGLAKFEEMVNLIVSLGAKPDDNKDIVQENNSVQADGISTKQEVAIKQKNEVDTINREKEIWVCGRCQTENSFALDNCKKCRKEFNPPL